MAIVVGSTTAVVTEVLRAFAGDVIAPDVFDDQFMTVWTETVAWSNCAMSEAFCRIGMPCETCGTEEGGASWLRTLTPAERRRAADEG